MDPLNTTLRDADPAGSLDPASEHAAQRMAANAAHLADTPPQPTGRRIRPAVAALAVGGIAVAATAAAAPVVLDLFSAESAVVASTIELDVPVGGGAASCTAYLNVVPANGEFHEEANGFDLSDVPVAANFDTDDYQATEAFLRDYDWGDDIAALAFAGTTTSLDDEGNTVWTVPGTEYSIKERAEAVLAENGLNTTGSAYLIESGSCEAVAAGDQGDG